MYGYQREKAGEGSIRSLELTYTHYYIRVSLVKDGKESACNTGDLSSVPGTGRSPREGNGYPLQFSCLKNSMDRGGWQAIVHGVPKSQKCLGD